MNLPTLAKDKANHFVYGALIFAVFYQAFSLFGRGWSREGAMLVVVVFAALKEGWDWWGNRQARKEGRVEPYKVEENDFSVTVLGGLVCYISAE